MSQVAIRTNVKLFGKQAELARTRGIRVEVVPGRTTCGELLTEIARLEPALAPSIGASVLAVNHEVASPTRVLDGGEELALIGLVGGG